MAAVTIRNLPDEVHRALKQRAAQHQRSAEAEMRAILEAAVRPQELDRIGTRLAALSRQLGITDADVELVRSARQSIPAEPIDLG